MTQNPLLITLRTYPDRSPEEVDVIAGEMGYSGVREYVMKIILPVREVG
jgi:hypothetical protein